MKQRKGRFFKVVSAVLVAVFAWAAMLPSVSYAWWGGNWYDYYGGGYYRHRRHSDGWNRAGRIIAGVGAGYLLYRLIDSATKSGSSSKSYAEQYGSKVAGLTTEEAAVFQAMENCSLASLNAFQCQTEEEFDLAKRVVKKFAGGYAYVGEWQDGSHYEVVFYRLSRTYEGKNAMGGLSQEQWAAYDLAYQLPNGYTKIPFSNKGFVEKVAGYVKQLAPLSRCMPDSDGVSFVIDKYAK